MLLNACAVMSALFLIFVSGQYAAIAPLPAEKIKQSRSGINADVAGIKLKLPASTTFLNLSLTSEGRRVPIDIAYEGSIDREPYSVHIRTAFDLEGAPSSNMRFSDLRFMHRINGLILAPTTCLSALTVSPTEETPNLHTWIQFTVEPQKAGLSDPTSVVDIGTSSQLFEVANRAAARQPDGPRARGQLISQALLDEIAKTSGNWNNGLWAEVYGVPGPHGRDEFVFPEIVSTETFTILLLTKRVHLDEAGEWGPVWESTVFFIIRRGQGDELEESLVCTGFVREKKNVEPGSTRDLAVDLIIGTHEIKEPQKGRTKDD